MDLLDHKQLLYMLVEMRVLHLQILQKNGRDLN